MFGWQDVLCTSQRNLKGGEVGKEKGEGIKYSVRIYRIKTFFSCVLLGVLSYLSCICCATSRVERSRRVGRGLDFVFFL